VNKAMFNSIQINFGHQQNQQLTTLAGGRQLVVIGGSGDSSSKTTQQSIKSQPKMIIDLSKPPPSHQSV